MSRRAASISVATWPRWCCIPWKFPMGVPNCTRWNRYGITLSYTAEHNTGRESECSSNDMPHRSVGALQTCLRSRINHSAHAHSCVIQPLRQREARKNMRHIPPRANPTQSAAPLMAALVFASLQVLSPAPLPPTSRVEGTRTPSKSTRHASSARSPSRGRGACIRTAV